LIDEWVGPFDLVNYITCIKGVKPTVLTVLFFT